LSAEPSHAERERGEGRDQGAHRTRRQEPRIDVQLEAGRIHGADPPRAQALHDDGRVADRAEHAERGARRREYESFHQQHPPHVTAAEADREQESELLGALLDAEREEHPGQQQPGDDEEKAEVDEVLAEIGRAVSRSQGFGADVADR
jgi:hypothetical protein